MPMFVMLTSLTHGSLDSPRNLETLEREVADTIRNHCPKVEWVQNLTVTGPCDYLDVFKAPDLEEAMKVATIVRTFGHAHTEVWGATEWSRYKELIGTLPQSNEQ